MSDEFTYKGKADLLKQIHVEREALETLIARIPESELDLPGAVGVWSTKDALAHISAWERRMLAWIGSHLRGENPEIPLPWNIERMNAEAHARDRDLPLKAVMEEFRRSYRDGLALVESMTEKQLVEEHLDTWPMAALWLGVAANMNIHYKEHREDIEKWLASREKEA